jgi:hypothetical protein
MNKYMTNSVLGLLMVVGFLASPAHADLGLKKILSEQSVQALGLAVMTAAKEVFDATDDPEKIKPQLVVMLNEAAATGDERAMRYAIVAVMRAGGVENLDLCKTAINNSDLFANHPEMLAPTVAEAEKLIRSGGGADKNGKTEQGGGGTTAQGGGGTSDPTLGGGTLDVFDTGADGNIDDNDSDATKV